MALTVEKYLRKLDSRAGSLMADAAVAGVRAAVPTCPGWTVADLLWHVGVVQRWATDIVTGARSRLDVPPDDASPTDAPAAPPDDEAGLMAWVVDGFTGLRSAMDEAPDDLSVPVFLHAAPPPRLFWARREAHEMTVHAVDMAAARLGRPPTSAEAKIAPDFAADGIDELVVGFLGRRSSTLRTARPVTVAVRPTDIDASWTLHLSADRPAVSTGTDAGGEPDTVLTSTAAALYLGLWNRGEEITETGDADILAQWRENVRVEWG